MMYWTRDRNPALGRSVLSTTALWERTSVKSEIEFVVFEEETDRKRSVFGEQQRRLFHPQGQIAKMGLPVNLYVLVCQLYILKDHLV